MRSPGGRKPMERKGIGKLAPFGIAAKIDVVTIAVSEVGGALITWFRPDLAGIRDQEAKHSTSYHPELILANAEPAQASDLGNPLVGEFIERIQSSGGASRLFPTGTFVLLSGLTLNRVINPGTVLEAMGRRFTVTLLRPDFSITLRRRARPSFTEFEGRSLCSRRTRLPRSCRNLQIDTDPTGSNHCLRLWGQAAASRNMGGPDPPQPAAGFEFGPASSPPHWLQMPQPPQVLRTTGPS
jgi:hypothetical protein